jgi:cation diffusion facilitator CzcD-associated flavoprotein CzcO
MSASNRGPSASTASARNVGSCSSRTDTCGIRTFPDVPGTFASPQIHSGPYRNTDDLAGARVLVVGAGNSGCDLAVDAAQHRFDVGIVVRRGMHFQPKAYFACLVNRCRSSRSSHPRSRT